METDFELLRTFATCRDEPVFRALVERHAGFVLSVAHRVAGGDRQLAEDIAQGVFVQLAQEAGCFPERVPLTAWLHRRTVFAAANAVRSERRRKAREQTAASLMSTRSNPNSSVPVDEALNSLAPCDRAVLMLRYYEDQSLREIGDALGLSEDTAQKRVSRALERLRVRLAAGGATSNAAAVALTLAATMKESAATVPPTLCERLANRALQVTERVSRTASLLRPLVGTVSVLTVGVLVWTAQERELRALRANLGGRDGSVAAERADPASRPVENPEASPGARRRDLSELLSVMKHESSQMTGALSDAQLAAAVEEIADADLPAALSEILRWNRYQKTRVLSGLSGTFFREWSRRDAAAAFEAARSHMDDPVVAWSALRDTYLAFAKLDPKGAVEWVAKQSFAAPGSTRESALFSMATLSYKVDPRACLEAGGKMPEGKVRTAFEANAWNTFSQQSPEEAKTWALERPLLKDRLRYVLNLRIDPIETINSALAAIPDEQRAEATAEAAGYWVYRQHERGTADRWLLALPLGPARDAALQSAAAASATRGDRAEDFLRACDLATQITGQAQRAEVLQGVMLRWGKRDAAGAAAFLDRCTWQEADKESIRSLLP